MSSNSEHIEQIIDRQEGVDNLQVVFVDIEKYSRCNTVRQREIISLFNKPLEDAKMETTRKYAEKLGDNNINLKNDLIFLPTGDGEPSINKDTPGSIKLKEKNAAKKSSDNNALKIDEENPEPIRFIEEFTLTVISKKESLPIFIATDIEGCVTPQFREEIDLAKLEKLRMYCQFVKKSPQYPQLVFFTGRSQGYVEFLMQSLGMINTAEEWLPSVIENGAALYFPKSRKIQELSDKEQLHEVNKARVLLHERFNKNKFEPKGFMITINNLDEQSIQSLKDEIDKVLEAEGYKSSLETATSATAVDITAHGVNKLFGINKVLEHYRQRTGNGEMKDIVAIGDHTSDFDVLRAAGKAYCPFYSDGSVQTLIKKRFGESHIIQEGYVDLILHVIKEECGIEIK